MGSRPLAALFGDAFLGGQIAMRGGTLLHKGHLLSPARYSEDIDLYWALTTCANPDDPKWPQRSETPRL